MIPQSAVENNNRVFADFTTLGGVIPVFVEKAPAEMVECLLRYVSRITKWDVSYRTFA
jgi:hypothetical protein